ncbi:MAG: helicase-related protein [Acidobacteriota bacterium]
MRRNEFKTGQRHQEAVARWIRCRLADNGCRQFKFQNSQGKEDRVGQYGVLVADGVGLGKTWEALAATSLLLLENSRARRDGAQRENRIDKPAHVLVLCPPGLVSKWAFEIIDPSGFSARLDEWISFDRDGRRKFIRKTFERVYEIRRTDSLPKGERKWKQDRPPDGTYVCNWNAIRKSHLGRGRSRASAFLRNDWDVVIVDEAHHPEARQALQSLTAHADRLAGRTTFILLTATPFQLEPIELHRTFGTMMDKNKGAYKVLYRQPVKGFVEEVSRHFTQTSDQLDLSSKRGTEKTLRQLMTRTGKTAKRRLYLAISADGLDQEHEDPSAQVDLSHLKSLLIKPSPEFERWYFVQRLKLAEGTLQGRKTCVQTKLRQALSTPKKAQSAFRSRPPHSPRLDALARWLRKQTEEDFLKTARDGHPRKTIIFTSFVGSATKEIREVAEQAITSAFRAVRANRLWAKMRDPHKEVALMRKNILNIKGKKLNRLLETHRLSRGFDDALNALFTQLDDPQKVPIVHALLGNRKYRLLVQSYLIGQLNALKQHLDCEDEPDLLDWTKKLLKPQRNRLRYSIAKLAEACQYMVGSYTGQDDRKDRDTIGEAFQSPLAPYILIASNVGSEGVDLQRHSQHLVHFDIEWNPARMEQREGRIARLGCVRKREPVCIYHLLVQNTYDERMLHQLVARQRWHSVLLGKSGARLAKDESGEIEAPSVDTKDLRRLTLNLSPE